MADLARSDAFGAQVRSWRLARRVSQEQLAARAGVSTRHLSFVENGKSRPSREVVLALAGALDVPLRERNALLAAAGFSAAFRASPLEADELASLRRAIDHVLAKQEPYGAVVVDGKLDVVRMNRGAARVFARLPPTSPDGVAAAHNLILGTVHPAALRPYIVNWKEVAGHLVARLHREVGARPHDEGLAQLLVRVLAQPGVPAEWRIPEPGRSTAPFLGVHLRGPDLELRLFTMLSSIGTPLDVTAEELHIETYYPADEDSERVLRDLASGD
ncbi:MAG: helix-turn-helix transcriptional regulator [Deltaproteobacteria bacterium]|nr:helix-turn-helix transcriptional regulator [Deltaproteobacteria bacterium]MCW5803801.1 helix-turn-helix transcriptional regulator [Deltaproteobacteria bacterium]